ncbi:MAG TPA: branched-chain amino acid ABC transporter permease, partial [Anaerolineae bacterium]
RVEMRTLLNVSFWLLLIVVGFIAILPILTDSATLREDLFLILVVVTLATSLNIIMGYTGYVSFGHIVFFGLGGYFAFYLVQTFSLHILAAALAAGLGASVIAFLLGTPVLRLRGAYFALATIGINEAMRAFMNNFDLFGGALGMFFNYAVYDTYGGAKNASQLAYYALVVIALGAIATSFLIKKSKFGLGLLAIREDQDAAQVLGIDPARLKVIAYTISAFFPALAGAFFFFKNGIIEPAIAFDLQRSIESLVMVMLGGYGTVTGPIVGAVLYDRLRSSLITNETFSNFNQFIAGVLLLIIVLFVTAGVVGWLRQRVPALRRYLE